MDNETLGKKIFASSLWAMLMRQSVRFLGIVSILILARILGPEDFGIVAKATLIYGTLELISQFGFQNALLKMKKVEEGDYNSAWTMGLIRSAVISLVLLLLSWPASIFFNEPDLLLIICVYALISLVDGFVNIGIINFRIEMKFELDFKFHFIKKLAAFIVTILTAYVFQTYWALVFGTFINVFCGMLLSFIMSSFRPKLDLSKWRELMDFSKWVIGYELMTAVSTKLDLFILSKFASTETVGIYTVSYEIAGTPSTEISQPVARASLPGLAKINDNLELFSDMYTNILTFVLFITIPACIGLAAVAEQATYVLLGEKWMSAAELIPIIAMLGLVRASNATAVAAYMAYNVPSKLTKIASITFLLRLVALPYGMYLDGVIGLCWGAVIAASGGALVNFFIQSSLGLVNLKKLCINTYRPLVGSIFMLITICYFDLQLSILNLIYLVLGGAFVFLFVTFGLYMLFPSNGAPEEKISEALRKIYSRVLKR